MFTGSQPSKPRPSALTSRWSLIGPVLVYLAVSAFLQAFFPDWSWQNTHVDSVVDGLGGAISFALGLSLLLVLPYRARGNYLPIAASAFIAMGMVEMLGLFTENIHVSLWIDCWSLAIGALFLTALWVPVRWLSRFVEMKSLVWVIGFPFALSLWMIFFGDAVLPHAIGHIIPWEIRALSFLSGLIFLLSLARAGKVIPGIEGRLVGIVCLYQGLGAAAFPIMKLWGAQWWIVQVLQLIPYLIALGYLVRLFLANQKAQLLSEERFRTLVEASPIGIGVIDNRNHSWLKANPALCKMLGYSEAELAAIPVKNLIHPDDVFDVLEDRNKLLRGEVNHYRHEKRYLRSDGKEIWVRASGALILSESGSKQEFRLLEDISTEKEAREETKRLMERLSRSNSELERFASIASHDLLSPLNTIGSYIQLLELQLNQPIGEDAKLSMKFMVDACNRLRTLIKDLLTYSRVSNDAQRLQPNDCAEVVEEVTQNLKFDIEACQAKVSHGPLPTVEGDPFQISQLFQNLIGNAIKYRGTRPPEVQISAEQKDGEWQFTVADNGIGFDMKNVEKIFTEFQRLHSTREYPGHGLGLPICKTIVARHGGRIWATSVVGAGSKFYFTLPVTARRPLPLDSPSLGGPQN